MKKLLCLLLALMLVFACLAGCSGDTDEGDANNDSNSPSSDGDTIKVGLLAPLTGDVAEYGIAVANGVRMYTEELNANGGINGKTIELVEYDEEGDEARAVTGYNYLMDEGVVAIIGDVTTGPTVAVVAESQADGIPMITASATAMNVTYDEETDTLYENMFRSCFIDPFQGEKMASFAVEIVGAETAAVLYNNGSDYSMGCAESFVEMAGELGLEIVANESYANEAVDFQGQLTNIAAENPDVLFVPDYYNTIALVAQQAASAGVNATMLGVDGWDTVLNVVTDPALIEGAYYCAGYSTQNTSEAVQNFLSAYQEKYDSVPNMFAAQGYDAAMIMYDAIAKADADGSLDNETIIGYLKATDMDCVTGHVTYDEYNNPEKTASIINIVNGEAEYWGNY